MKIYIAGPMTGLPDYNHPAFHEAAKRFRAADWNVLNPAETDGGDTSKARSYYMRQDFEKLLQADAIALLPGWENSLGARIEFSVAGALDLPTYDAETMKAREYPAWVAVQAEQGEPARTSILLEADRLVTGARREAYGHPREDYGRTADIFYAMTGIELKPWQAVAFMLCVKLSREMNAHSRDNLVDLAGYAACLQSVHECPRDAFSAPPASSTG